MHSMNAMTDELWEGTYGETDCVDYIHGQGQGWYQMRDRDQSIGNKPWKSRMATSGINIDLGMYYAEIKNLHLA